MDIILFLSVSLTLVLHRTLAVSEDDLRPSADNLRRFLLYKQQELYGRGGPKYQGNPGEDGLGYDSSVGDGGSYRASAAEPQLPSPTRNRWTRPGQPEFPQELYSKFSEPQAPNDDLLSLLEDLDTHQERQLEDKPVPDGPNSSGTTQHVPEPSNEQELKQTEKSQQDSSDHGDLPFGQALAGRQLMPDGPNSSGTTQHVPEPSSEQELKQTKKSQQGSSDDPGYANGGDLPFGQALTAPEPNSKNPLSDVYFVVIVAGCSAAAIFGVIAAGYCFYRFQKNSKAAAEVDYPAYGVTGPNKDQTSPNGDRRLAQSAQMYHYQHQKQQMIAVEKATTARNTSASDIDSEEENEDGDYTVYECPGLAPTGEMEVKNPLFQDDSTPMSPPVLSKDVKKP